MTTTEWTPPPPGDRREQLPDDILALLPRRVYVSTACETARDAGVAMTRNPQRAQELGRLMMRMHKRCRVNHKFRGTICSCSCHLH